MQERPKGQIQNARLTGVEVVMRYPLGFADFEYKEVVDGVPIGDQQTLRLLLTSEECKTVAAQIEKLGLSIEAYGGTKN